MDFTPVPPHKFIWSPNPDEGLLVAPESFGSHGSIVADHWPHRIQDSNPSQFGEGPWESGGLYDPECAYGWINKNMGVMFANSLPQETEQSARAAIEHEMNRRFGENWRDRMNGTHLDWNDHWSNTAKTANDWDQWMDPKPTEMTARNREGIKFIWHPLLGLNMWETYSAGHPHHTDKFYEMQEGSNWPFEEDDPMGDIYHWVDAKAQKTHDGVLGVVAPDTGYMATLTGNPDARNAAKAAATEWLKQRMPKQANEENLWNEWQDDMGWDQEGRNERGYKFWYDPEYGFEMWNTNMYGSPHHYDQLQEAQYKHGPEFPDPENDFWDDVPRCLGVANDNGMLRTLSGHPEVREEAKRLAQKWLTENAGFTYGKTASSEYLWPKEEGQDFYNPQYGNRIPWVIDNDFKPHIGRPGEYHYMTMMNKGIPDDEAMGRESLPYAGAFYNTHNGVVNTIYGGGDFTDTDPEEIHNSVMAQAADHPLLKGKHIPLAKTDAEDWWDPNAESGWNAWSKTSTDDWVGQLNQDRGNGMKNRMAGGNFKFLYNTELDTPGAPEDTFFRMWETGLGGGPHHTDPRQIRPWPMPIFNRFDDNEHVTGTIAGSVGGNLQRGQLSILSGDGWQRARVQYLVEQWLAQNSPTMVGIQPQQEESWEDFGNAMQSTSALVGVKWDFDPDEGDELQWPTTGIPEFQMPPDEVYVPDDLIAKAQEWDDPSEVADYLTDKYNWMVERWWPAEGR